MSEYIKNNKKEREEKHESNRGKMDAKVKNTNKNKDKIKEKIIGSKIISILKKKINKKDKN